MTALGVELVVVGGCARVLAGAADECADLDLVPEPSTANLTRLAGALAVIGARPDATVASLARSVLASYDTPYGRIDLMLQTGRDEYAGLRDRATAVRYDDVAVAVVSPADVARLRREHMGDTRYG